MTQWRLWLCAPNRVDRVLGTPEGGTLVHSYASVSRTQVRTQESVDSKEKQSKKIMAKNNKMAGSKQHANLKPRLRARGAL
ncbi:MAG: hypothetical protein GY820_17975 [Gammaproteobacteria bacterium]|nr:hypothetical protein [Gammaproteobacteria bacterium]